MQQPNGSNNGDGLGQSKGTKIIDAKKEIENIVKIQQSQSHTEPPVEPSIGRDPIAAFGRFLFESPKRDS